MRIITIVYTLLVGYVYSKPGDGNGSNCRKIASYWFENKLNETSSFSSENMPVIHEHAPDGICQSGFHCCNSRMEQILSDKADSNYNKLVLSHMTPLIEILITQKRLYDHLISTIELSEKNCKNLFETTYGMKYLKNKHLFIEFYQKMSTFIKGSDAHHMQDIADDFFHELFYVLVKLSKQNLILDSKAKLCLKISFDKLNPFGDVYSSIRNKLVISLKRTRIFLQSLFVARDVINAISKKTVTSNCYKAHRTLTMCNICKNKPKSVPCYSYCTAVMNMCLNEELDFQKHWEIFLTIMEENAFHSSLGFESIFKNLPLQISDMIMSFQSISNSTLEKMITACNIGSSNMPRSNTRLKRSLALDTSDLDNKNKDGLKIYIEKLVNRLSIYKDIWKNRANSYCQSMTKPMGTMCSQINGHVLKNQQGLNGGTKAISREVLSATKQIKEAINALRLARHLTPLQTVLSLYKDNTNSKSKASRNSASKSDTDDSTRGSGDVGRGAGRGDDEDDEEYSSSGEGSGDDIVNSGQGTKSPDEKTSPAYTVVPPVDEPGSSTKPLAAFSTLAAAAALYLLLTTS